MARTLPPSRLSSIPAEPAELDLSTFVRQAGASISTAEAFVGFFDRLGIVERERLERTWRCMHAVAADPRAASEAELLVRAMPDDDDGEGARVLRTFAEALLSRIQADPSTGGNLYLGARPPGAQLRAFELLRLRTPLIPFAYAASNKALLECIDAPGEVTLIDVGIGRGGQVRALLENPNARRLITHLHVVAIEPDSSPDTRTGALEVAERAVLSAAQEAGIPASVHPVAARAEDLTAEHLRSAGMRGRILANAAFCLHHVSEVASRTRVDVLRLLREMGAEAVVLVEPDSDHATDDLARRFVHAYRHYRSVDKSLSSALSPTNASLVWNEFFAPEVRNILSQDGNERTERHQESMRWAAHLRAAGWTLDQLSELIPLAAAPAGFDLHSHEGVFSLAFEGVDLLSVMRARA